MQNVQSQAEAELNVEGNQPFHKCLLATNMDKPIFDALVGRSAAGWFTKVGEMKWKLHRCRNRIFMRPRPGLTMLQPRSIFAWVLALGFSEHLEFCWIIPGCCHG